MAFSHNDVFQKIVFQHFDEIPSTHQYSLEYISKSRPKHVFCITSDFQTDGIGQHGRKWYAPKNQNLNLSLIMNTVDLSSNFLFKFNMMVSISVFEAISQFANKPLTIKWPNDILHKNNKIAGILIHSQLNGPYIQYFIVSVGVNLTTTFPDNMEHVIALKDISTRRFSADEVKLMIIERLSSNYQTLLKKGNKHIFDTYHKNLYKKGQIVSFKHDKLGIFKATIMGVDINGRLILNRIGKLEKFNQGELTYLYE